MSQPFKFKEFTVHQERAAMKIGTDAVLLGAWASLEHTPQSILDIGTGTGIIALMMAQRSNAELLDAIEIDDAAYEQAVDNFEASQWGDRLFCYHAGLDEFSQEMADEQAYELIISNPPFYVDSHSSNDPQRDMARSSTSLSFQDLVEGVDQILAPHGQFAVIIPRMEEEGFLEIAKKFKLHPSRITRVKGNPQAPEKRSLIQFSYNQQLYTKEVLIIETNRHHYTPEYIALTKDFYLKM